MLEFLMRKIEEVVSENEYLNLLSEFKRLEKEKRMQDWIFMVKDVIGLEKYNNIKELYIQEHVQEEGIKEKRHCAPVKKNTVILFQKNIGASDVVSPSVDEFMVPYNHVLYGLI